MARVLSSEHGVVRITMKVIYIARRELCYSEKALSLSGVFKWFHFVDRFYTLRINADAVC